MREGGRGRGVKRAMIRRRKTEGVQRIGMESEQVDKIIYTDLGN